MDRRDFIKIGAILSIASTQAKGFSKIVGKAFKKEATNKEIDFLWDGLNLTPVEYASLLMKLADENKIKPDYYSNGGVVEELENKFAKLLGKESAVFMPTGTMANHIAVRQLADKNKRVIVQEQSHLYNDCGDCAQTLSNINLIPLGLNSVAFTLDEIASVNQKSKVGRVPTKVGAISIESPVRRQHDSIVTYDEMKKISDYARNEGIKMHLDGARLFVQSVHTNIHPSQYCELFDTAYTSLWKCFNSGSGAILAGSKSFTEGLFNVRRMFGASLPYAWPYAAVALHFADGFLDEYKAALSNAEKFLSLIEADERFKVEKFSNGTHIFQLLVDKTDPNKFRQALSKKNVQIPAPNKNGFMLKINPSINRDKPENLARLFIESLNVN